MEGSRRTILLMACLATASSAWSTSVLAADTPRKSYTLAPDGTWKQVAAPAAPIAPSAGDANASASPQATQPGEAMRTATTTRPAEIAALDAIAAKIAAGNFGDAYRDDVRWLKAHPDSPSFDRGLYLAAVALKGDLNLIRAFYYCDELLDEHPESVRYRDALTLQYEMADLYLNGLKDTLLGLRIVDRDDAAIDMLFRIQNRAPGSPVAEKALLRTADYYWSDDQFDLAADAYDSYFKAYPRSALVPQARLRQAYANLAQFHGPAFDSTSVLNARAQLQQLIVDYPDLAQQDDLPAKVVLADRQLARKLVIRADYYRRTGQPDSAVKLCRREIAAYPDLPETKDAREMLARLAPATQTEASAR